MSLVSIGGVKLKLRRWQGYKSVSGLDQRSDRDHQITNFGGSNNAKSYGC